MNTKFCCISENKKTNTVFRFIDEFEMAARAVKCNRKPEFGWEHRSWDGIVYSWSDIEYMNKRFSEK